MGKETMPRILIVAPSNAAVDEVAKKLLALRREIPEDIRFRLLRMGVTRSMDPHVQNYSIDDLVFRAVRNADHLQHDIETKQRRANNLYDQKTEAEEDGKDDLALKYCRDYKNLQEQIKKLKSELKKPLDSNYERELRRKEENRILIE